MNKYSCPICNTSCSIIMNLEFSDVAYCDYCKHSFSVNIKKKPEDIYSEEYFTEKHKNYFDNPDLELFSDIQDIVLQYKSKNAEIIDIGCGTGNLLKYLKESGFNNLTGIDLISNEYDGIEFIQSDILSYHFNKKFDVVTTIMNIEHIDKPHEYIKFLHSLLIDNGILIVNTVNENSLIYKMAKMLYFLKIDFAASRLYDPHHLIHFSNISLNKLCEANGFKLLSSSSRDRGLEAIDLPDTKFKVIIKSGIWCLSFLSKVFDKGFTQTQMFIKR